MPPIGQLCSPASAEARLFVNVISGPSPVCRASGYARPVLGVPPEEKLKGLSFAVANVTGLLARELPAGCRPSVEVALGRLRRLSNLV